MGKMKAILGISCKLYTIIVLLIYQLLFGKTGLSIHNTRMHKKSVWLGKCFKTYLPICRLPGAALIGTDFVWLQFPYYVLGAVVSILLLSILAEKGF